MDSTDLATAKKQFFFKKTLVPRGVLAYCFAATGFPAAPQSCRGRSRSRHLINCFFADYDWKNVFTFVMKRFDMAKKLPSISHDSRVFEDPAAVCFAKDGLTTPVDQFSVKERMMGCTMSVDEYFDELIAQVREDYASI